ncbi:hypothetical protein BJX76DRAFT_115 [Aspergillus varians]
MDQGFNDFLKALQDAMAEPTVSKDDPKALCLKALETQYELLRKWTTPFVSQTDFNLIRLKVVKDSDDRYLQFFTPWPLQELSSFPIDSSNQKLIKDVRRSYDGIDYGCDKLRKYGFPLSARLEIIHTCFISEVQRWPRRDPGGQTQRLSSLTRWKFIELYAPYVDLDKLGGVEWECHGGWVLSGSSGKYPHFKAAMHSAVEVCDADQLLRSELLIILGIMVERLRDKSLNKHVIIPVMLFSFVGPRSGRILMAYFDGQHLIVQQSPLYNFPGSPGSDAMLEFVRHQAAGLTPNMDTTRFPKPIEQGASRRPLPESELPR